MVEKIREVTSLKKFKPVIEIKGVQDREKEELFNDYIITEEIANNFEMIFEEMTLCKSEEKRRLGEDINPSQIKRAFLLRGSYGTGKSYFLLTLSTILEEISNGNGDKIKEKFKDFDGIVYQVDKLMEEGKYFVVSINGVSETNIDFEDSIIKNFIEKSRVYFPEEDFVSMSSFEKAARSLEKSKEEPMKWNLISTEMEKMDLDYDSLISGLNKYKRKSLKEYQKLMEEAYGIPINIHDNEFSTFIKESSEYIKKKGYKGIVYVFDEFSAYLTSLIEDGRINKNLSKIQELAQACYPSNQNDVVFISSIHKSLSILLKSTILEKEELDKVVERFKEVEMDFSEGEELVKNTIRVNEFKYQLMRNEYDEIKYLDEKTNGMLEFYYPVHPQTIHYLNTLSKLYAQENRTLFRFMSDVVDKKIRTENVVVDGELNIIMMDCLYDYFIETAAEDNISIITSANDALRWCNEEWQKKVIKSLVVSRIAAYDAKGGYELKTGLSVDDLSEFLLISDKKMLENFLRDVSNKTNVNIFYDKENNVYEFMENTINKINLEKEKVEMVKGINEYDELLKLIREMGKNREFYNRKINIAPIVDVTPVKREFQSEVYNYSNLMKVLEKGMDLESSNDGNLIHLLPQYFETDLIDIKQIEEYMKEYGDNVVIAVPKKYDFNRETIIEYAIYNKMLNDEKYLKDENVKQYLVKEKNKYESILAKKIDEYTKIKNFLFVFNSGNLEFDSYDDLFAYMLKKYYYKFPDINSPIRSERRVSNQIIKTFIVPGEKVITKSSNAEEDRLIKDMMKTLDLAEIRDMPEGNVKAELKIPIKGKNEISAEIFDIVCNSEKKEIFDILEKSPYGMPEFLIELYIACAACLGKIYIYKGEKLLPIDPEVVGNIKNNDKLETRKAENDLDYDELKYAVDLWKIIGKPISSTNYTEFNPEKGIKDKIKMMASIASDSKIFLSKFRNNIDIFTEKGFNFDVIEKLCSEIELLNETIEPENYIKNMNKLPSKVVGEVDKTRALKKLEDYIERFAVMTEKENMKNHLNMITSCNIIDESKHRFETNEQLMKQYKEINLLKEQFLKEPLIFKKISKLDKLVKDFFNMFNNLYKTNHQNLYKKIEIIKNEINSKPEVELIEALEKFKFKEVKTLSKVHKNIRDIICTNKFEENLCSDLYSCDCMGENSRIDDFDDKYQEFMDEVEECEKELLGVIRAYRERFVYLDRQSIQGKKSLREFIEDKDGKILDTYMEFMRCLNDNPVRNREFIIKNSTDLSKVIIEYEKYISTSDKKIISFKDLSKDINSSIKFSGRARMGKDEFLDIVKNILDEKGENMSVIISFDD